ncbi:cytochrome ubiquinol oxidase subunit I [Legionella yabuuchiae]|uniref:cytochrome ubiquinol oxidase subunit I n=1 Tax=Legionella yabuuchiae TaxID=376727 RepID=UPI0010563B7E|nr:cytochrome ubiquinol oxidase subunit I [Legionella yabuuchiae]
MLVEILSRIQFAFSIGFHILFPTLNLGLALFIAGMEATWLYTQNPIYLRLCKFWVKVFALTFGMGVVSGIVLAYQIGTNFGPFISGFGNILGALFAYETLTAFFLEAGFLGVMLFGWGRVHPYLHFFATLFVTLGTTVSAFWIMSANSWMQTPSGYEILEGKYLVANWWDIVFNPSFIPRVLHMLFASYTTTCFVLAGIASYFLLKHRFIEMSRRVLSIAMWSALVVVPLQIAIGDKVGLDVHQYQPLKTAAMEGVWETQRGAPLLLFAWPSQTEQKNEYVIGIPKLASLINTHEWDGELIGLRSVPRQDQPLVAPVFYTFRIMVGIGVLMLGTALAALFMRRNERLYKSSWFHYWCLFMAPLGFVAAIAGWLTAEIGRQPWVVYNLMRTRDAVSAITMEEVIISLCLLILAYGVIFGFYLYYLMKTIRKGPKDLRTDEIEHHTFQYMTDMKGEKK